MGRGMRSLIVVVAGAAVIVGAQALKAQSPDSKEAAAVGMAVESPGAVGYSAAGRRDPFTPPRGSRPGVRRTCPGSGLAAEVVDAVALRGIVRGPEGARVLLLGPGGVSYFGRVGDRLCDARLVGVSGTTVRFERDPDPLAFGEGARAVVKTLGQ